MRRLLLAVLFLGSISVPGCTWYDAAFNVFGDHYSGGGTNSFDRRAKYDAAVRSYGVDQ
jgi:hypothetical protein